MMTQAFYTGLSGLKSNQTAIDATSDNIANASTVGYRSYDVEFSSMFEDALTTSGNSTSVDSGVGIGTSIQTAATNLESGALALTSRSTDLAINGDGWFGVQGSGEPMYTRAGNFTFDVNNDLVTPEGYYVLGTLGGNIDGEVLTKQIDDIPLGNVNEQKKLRFPKTLQYPAEPTTNTSFLMNLGVENEVQTISAGIVDVNGEKNELKLTFTQSAVQNPPGISWDVVATTQSLDGETIFSTQNGVVNFDSSGALISSTLNGINHKGVNIAIDLGSGYGGVISSNTPSTSGSSVADGTIGGDLIGYDINRNAEVIATFSNGMQSSVGKIAVYHFQNDQGLSRLDGSKFVQSSNSGEPLFFQDAQGNNILGTEVMNFRVENSNVRMEVALSELIILQRSYDSNSKVITTADQMLQKAIDMDA